MCVIYYYAGAKSLIYLLTLYRKSEVSDLSHDEIKELRLLVKQLEES